MFTWAVICYLSIYGCHCFYWLTSVCTNVYVLMICQWYLSVGNRNICEHFTSRKTLNLDIIGKFTYEKKIYKKVMKIMIPVKFYDEFKDILYIYRN